MQKPRFWLAEPESHPLFRLQLAHLCDGGLQSKLCLLLVPGRGLFLRGTARCPRPCQRTKRLPVKGSDAAVEQGYPTLILCRVRSISTACTHTDTPALL